MTASSSDWLLTISRWQWVSSDEAKVLAVVTWMSQPRPCSRPCRQFHCHRRSSWSACAVPVRCVETAACSPSSTASCCRRQPLQSTNCDCLSRTRCCSPTRYTSATATTTAGNVSRRRVNDYVRRCSQLRFDCDSTAVQLPFNCNSTPLWPLYNAAYPCWAAK